MSALSVIAPYDSEGAEFQIKPAIAIGEEYNDNIFLTPQDRSGDFISRVVPAIAFFYKAPLWDWDVNAFYEYRYYARFHDNISQSNIPSFNLSNHTTIKDQYIYLDVKENYSRVSLDPTRNFTQESAFVNQTDTNTLTVDPYFLMRPTSQMTVTTGYTYSNLWYKDPNAVNQTTNTIYTGFQQEMSERSRMIAGVRYTENENKIQSYKQDDLYLGQRYEYLDKSSLTITVGNSWFHLKDGESTSQVTWDAALIHIYSTMKVTYETGLRFITDPREILRREDRYLATLTKDTERTSVNLSGGLLEYRNIINKHLENSTYLITGMISHAITTKLKIFLNFEVDWYKDYIAYTKSERYLTGVRLEHLLAKNLFLAVAYNYALLYSPDNYSENYFSNKYSVELRMDF